MYELEDEDYRRPRVHNIKFVPNDDQCQDCIRETARAQSEQPLKSSENLKIFHIGCPMHPTD